MAGPLNFILRILNISVLGLNLLALVLGLVFWAQPWGALLRDNLLVIFLSSLMGLALVHLIFYIPTPPYSSEKSGTLPSDHETRLQRMLEYTLDNSSELIYWVDEKNQISRINQRALDLLGYESTEVIGQSPGFLDTHYDSEGMDEMRVYLRSGNYYFYETQHRKKNGGLLPVEAVLNLFVYGDEEVICAFCRDISEKKQSLEELDQARAIFELFMDGLPGGAFVRDPVNNKIVYSNGHLKDFNRKISQASPEGQNFPPALQKKFLDMETQAVESRQSVRWEADASPFLGHPQSFEVWMFPLFMKSRTPLIGGIVFDITQRKAEQDELYEKQVFLEATIAQSPVGIIILDGKTTNIRVLNRGAKEILGIPLEEDLEGKTIALEGLVWEVLTPERTPFPLQENPLYKAFFHETSSQDKMIVRRSDGQERYVMINSGPIYDKAGGFSAAIVAFLDITELKVAQEELETLNRDLEKLVADRTQALSQANQDLVNTIDDLMATQEQLIESEKMASLGELVAGVAHEINTPVGVSVTAASYLGESCRTITEAYRAQAMKKSDLEVFLRQAETSTALILTNLDRASNLIKSFKMISVDQSSGQERNFHLKAYFEDVFLSLHPPDKRLDLEVSVQGNEDLAITSFPGAFSQILTNLYMNSCVHGFEGQKDGKISLEFWKDQDRLHIRYQDNGKGMDEVTIKRIYEPFFTTKRNRGGSGLGMHIVFNLVTQKLGGTIKCQSEVGQGTAFLIEMTL